MSAGGSTGAHTNPPVRPSNPTRGGCAGPRWSALLRSAGYASGTSVYASRGMGQDFLALAPFLAVPDAFLVAVLDAFFAVPTAFVLDPPALDGNQTAWVALSLATSVARLSLHAFLSVTAFQLVLTSNIRSSLPIVWADVRACASHRSATPRCRLVLHVPPERPATPSGPNRAGSWRPRVSACNCHVRIGAVNSTRTLLGRPSPRSTTPGSLAGPPGVGGLGMDSTRGPVCRTDGQ